MRVPLSWLRDFAPIEGAPEDLAAALSDLGLVVEGMERVGEGLNDIVVARVLATTPHPAADRVQLVDVEAGDGEARRVVCGAFNFEAGDLLPLAPVGARLPGGMEIGRRKVRGQWSNGMLCSGRELGLSEDHDGILVLPAGLLPGTPLTDALGITPDVVFDLDVTPNRPDALSILGVARDLAARLKVPLAVPEPVVAGGRHDRVGSVTVEAPDLCPRFTATMLTGVVVGPSPGWLASRLTLAGMRPINNVVDISNYVMLELGQPNHPYDLERLGGHGLAVRRARDAEALVTLDGIERRLGADDCLICDAHGTPVGIAGVMGGTSSEIADSTTEVLLEAAAFDPLGVARTAKRLGLRTEASVRFERGVDPEGIERAVGRFCQLAADVAESGLATGFGPTVDVSAPRAPARPVEVRTHRVNALLGTTLAPDEVAGLLEPVGFHCEGDGADLRVSIPSWRPDCEREVDVIEEVARHYGYGRIPRTLPPIAQVGGLTARQRARRRAREAMAGAGLSEAWSTSLLAAADLERAGLDAAAVRVENPLAQEESVLRTSLLPGLLRAVATNLGRRHPDVRLFEVGTVFSPPQPGEAELPVESERIAAVLGASDAAEAKRLLDVLLGALEVADASLTPSAPAGMHPSRSAAVAVSGRPVGVVGEVDPAVLAAHDLAAPVGWFELDLGAIIDAPRPARQYRPVSRFPSADFDLALVVDDAVAAAEVDRALREAAGDLLEELWLFDVFRGPQLGEGRRSLAYRLRVAALDHTLDEGELADLRSRAIAAVGRATGATLRA